MTIAEILKHLVDRTDVDHVFSERVGDVVPTLSEVAAWSAQTGLTPTVVFNELALALARAYDTGDLSFTACDFIVNDLYEYTETQDLKIDVFWEVYAAFDAGEYHHSGDRADDPEETHTRRLVKALLSRAEQD